MRFELPSGIDIPAIMMHLKSLRDRDKVPGTLHKGMVNNLETGNNLAISREDYVEGMLDLGNDLDEECCPGFYVPIDKQDADILFFPTPKKCTAISKISSGGGKFSMRQRKTGPYL